MNRTFEALGTTVAVTVDDDVPNHDLAALLVAGYAEAHGAPALAFHLRGGSKPALERAGHGEIAVAAVEDLLPLLELELYYALVQLAPRGWLLHAAALERDGRAFVLAGPSGAGKTTLSLALLARGWRLVTEELVHISTTGIVRGLARPLHAPRTTAFPSGWRALAYPIRSEHRTLDGAIAQPPEQLRWLEPLPLAALVRIDHDPTFADELVALTGGSALPRLWPCALRQDDDALAAAAAILRTYPAHELRSSSVAAAIQLAERIATM